MTTAIIPLVGGVSSVDPGSVGTLYTATPAVTYVVHVYPPPVSSFMYTPSSVTVSLLVTFTDISPSAVPITSWAWDFGDGTTSALQSPPVHTYSSAGLYTVTLTVTDKNGARDTQTVPGAVNVHLPVVPVTTSLITPVVTYVVHVYPPLVSSFTSTPSGGTAPLLVTFTDKSTSAVLITRWAWDFGDGTTSALQNPPLHTYSSAGLYTVILSVTDGNGARDTRTIQGAVNVLTVAVPVPTVSPAVTPVVPVVTTVVPVYILPVSDFMVALSSGTAPLLVTFTDISRSAVPISSWVWDFGDGTTSTLQNPVHTYSSRGLYTVILTVTDAYGEKHTKTVLGAVNILQEIVPVTPSTITPAVTNVVPVYTLPVSAFTSTPSGGTAPLLVTFTDISRSAVPITSWAWNFGDGTTSALQNPPVHTYSAAGTYPITLDVTDAKGNPSIFADSIKVNPPATPPSGQMAPPRSPPVSTTPVSLIVQPCWGIAWLLIIICIALLAFIWRKKRS